MHIACKEVLLLKDNYAMAHIVQYSPIYLLNSIIFSVILFVAYLSSHVQVF